MDLFGEHFWPDGVILLSLGMLIGYLAGLMISRYLGGGKNVANSLEKVQQEHEGYKEEVSQHFATSAELLNNLTESYRDVYLHMAKSADKLCEDVPNGPLLDTLPEPPTGTVLEEKPEPEANPETIGEKKEEVTGVPNDQSDEEPIISDQATAQPTTAK